MRDRSLQRGLARERPHTDAVRDTLSERVPVRERCQFDPPDAVAEPLERVGTCLRREPRFAAATGAGERQQPGLHERQLDLLEFAFASDEARQLVGQVVRHAVK